MCVTVCVSVDHVSVAESEPLNYFFKKIGGSLYGITLVVLGIS